MYLKEILLNPIAPQIANTEQSVNKIWNYWYMNFFKFIYDTQKCTRWKQLWPKHNKLESENEGII